MKNMDLGILKRFFLNILHIEKNAIAGGGVCPAILETASFYIAASLFESGKLQLIHIGDLRCVVAGWWWYFRTGIYCCQKAACLFGGDVRRCSHSKWRLPLSAENPGFIGGKRENT